MYLNVKFTCGSGLSVYAWVYVFFSTYRVMNISAWRIRIKVLLLFIRPVVSASLWTHGLQHARPFCPSPSPRVCPSSCSLNQWCHPTISFFEPTLLLLPSIFPSIRIFPNEPAVHIRWPKYWCFSFSVSPSNEYSGLISFTVDLLAIQGTLKSLLQHDSLKASILWHSAFSKVQLSHLYMTTGETAALTMWT